MNPRASAIPVPDSSPRTDPMNPSQSTLPPRHRLLAWARRWHAWAGLFAALFLLVVAATGALLNYKRPVLSALGLEPMEPAQPSRTKASPSRPTPDVPGFNASTGLAAARIPASEALATAREKLGDVALDRIELKREAGTLVWKIKAVDEREVVIDTATGASRLKGRFEKVAPRGTPGTATRGTSTDWGRIALDLHTGKIGGEAGKAFMTAMAVVLIFLSLSGVYLWAKPLFVRRANARARGAVLRADTRAQPSPKGSVTLAGPRFSP